MFSTSRLSEFRLVVTIAAIPRKSSEIRLDACRIIASVTKDGPKTSADALPGDDWGTRLTKQIARTVNHYRREMGLTTSALAILCNIAIRDDENSDEIKATTLNNLFAGKRKSISVDEVIMFARVLGVPPVALIVPLGVENSSEAWPGQYTAIGTAFDAVVGNARWGSIFDEALRELPVHGGEEAAARHRDMFGDPRDGAAKKAHRVTRAMLESGRLSRKLIEQVLMFHDSAPSMPESDRDALLSMIRTGAETLKSSRDELRGLGVEIGDPLPMLSWVELPGVSDLPDDALRTLVYRAANDGILARQRKETSGGSPADPAE
jgi:hypothetical protein